MPAGRRLANKAAQAPVISAGRLTVKRHSHYANFGLAILLAGTVCLGGCDFFKTDRSRFLSPNKVIKSPDYSPINPILPNIGIVDQSQELVPNATFPTRGDWEYSDKDYVIGPTDFLEIRILDLFQEGLETPLQREVSASGYIDLPLLEQRIKAEGLTKEELKEAIAQAYSPEILRDPTVSVLILTRRQNTFSILGAVARPSTYNIIRNDMRLLEALALAGDVVQQRIRYIYVIRPAPAIRRAKAKAEKPTEPADAPTTSPPTLPSPLPTKPSAETAPSDVEAALRELGGLLPGTAPATPPATEPVTLPAPSAMPYLTETANISAVQASADASEPPDTSKPKWVYTNGRWVRLEQARPPTTRLPIPGARPADEQAGEQEPAVVTQPPQRDARPMRPIAPTPKVQQPIARQAEQPDPFGWKKADKSDLARIIAINLPKLKNGDPRMNIVIRDNDIIQIPSLEAGEFYVVGEVLRSGVYSLTGRRITVKMALAAAGNLSPLAWPENSILIRRVGEHQEQTIPINIEAIFRGEEPDVFLKPNDVIAVGTDVRAAFWAVMRNAFRMTYGFGFIYDRNFADPLFVSPTSKRFKAW